MSSVLDESALPDSALVDRHLFGDDRAFADLYARHFPRLLRFVQSRVSEIHTAEDLTQDAFARAYTSVNGLRDRSRFYPWLTVIARHLVNSHHRAARERVVPYVIEEIDLTEGPDDRVVRLADQADVRRALERISPRHRQILELRDADLSYAEIAIKMGVTERTVPPLLSRARGSFRREFMAVTRSRSITLALPGFLAWPLNRLLRLRDRLASFQAYLPEIGTLCTGAACIALTVGVLIGVSGTRRGPVHTGHAETALDQHAREPAEPLNANLADRSALGRVEDTTATVHPPPVSRLGGLAEVGTRMDRHEYGRDYARQMPHYEELGNFWFGADPAQMQRDLTSTLAGDTTWMEGS